MKDKRYSEEDVKDWERLPMVSSVITSGYFGAWLYYRDKRRDKIVNSEPLDKLAEKLKAEMIEKYPKNIFGVKAPTPFAHFSYRDICNLLDKVINELKMEDENV